jgi:hypothetical protein
MSSVARCHHPTSVLAPLRRSSSASIPARAVPVPVVAKATASCRSFGGWRWPPSIRGGGRAVAESGARAASSVTDDNAGGIGIADFYTGKNILITGGTGFVAKGERGIVVSFLNLPSSSSLFQHHSHLGFFPISSCGEDFKDESYHR